MRKNMEFIKDHECEAMKNFENISVEKYDVNGVIDWFHHLHLKGENDKAMAILFCPYCGNELK